MHSATVLPISQPGNYDSCDGLVTSTPNLWLFVKVADCVPVILVDPQKNIVAALHAGWRGSLERIVENGIQLMVQEFGTEPADITAYIGPSASVCCYEIGQEVAEKFTTSVTVRNNGSIILISRRKTRISVST